MVYIPPNTVNTNKPEEDKKAKKLDIKVYLLYAVLVVALLFVLGIYLKTAKKWQNKANYADKPYSFAKKSYRFRLPRNIFSFFSSAKNVFMKQTDPKKLKSQDLVLNGIFLSPENKFALINNVIVKEGDKIGDAVVLQINADFVELENSSSTFKLKPYKK